MLLGTAELKGTGQTDTAVAVGTEVSLAVAAVGLACSLSAGTVTTGNLC